MKAIPLCLALACLALGGCSTTAKVKDYAFTKAANTGNQYCQVRDPEMARSLVSGVNRELRENGAKFDLKIETVCDP